MVTRARVYEQSFDTPQIRIANLRIVEIGRSIRFEYFFITGNVEARAAVQDRSETLSFHRLAGALSDFGLDELSLAAASIAEEADRLPGHPVALVFKKIDQRQKKRAGVDVAHARID